MFRNKKFSKILLLLSFALSVNVLFAQSKVSHVTNNSVATDNEGYFYSLPKTHLKVELIVCKKEIFAGPLAAYAEKYLGLSGVQQSNSAQYEIKQIRISSFSQPDSDQLYFVQVDKRAKEAPKLVLAMTESGLIMGVNKRVDNLPESEEEVQINVKSNSQDDYFKYFAGYNFYKKTDTIVRKISIDTFNIERFKYNVSLIAKNPERKAAEIAQKLEKLRDDRYLLLTGFQEVSYGESMSYMDGQLKKMEAEYISLFTGYTKEDYIYKSFTIAPEKSQAGTNINLFRFSESQGIFDASDSRGSVVYIKLTPDQSTRNINKYLSSVAVPVGEMNGYYYRIPEFAEVEIVQGGKSIHKSNHLISQFGAVAKTPSLNTEIEFHPNTGSLKQVRLK